MIFLINREKKNGKQNRQTVKATKEKANNGILKINTDQRDQIKQ